MLICFTHSCVHKHTHMYIVCGYMFSIVYHAVEKNMLTSVCKRICLSTLCIMPCDYACFCNVPILSWNACICRQIRDLPYRATSIFDCWGRRQIQKSRCLFACAYFKNQIPHFHNSTNPMSLGRMFHDAVRICYIKLCHCIVHAFKIGLHWTEPMSIGRLAIHLCTHIAV